MGSSKFGVVLSGYDVGTLVTITSSRTFDDGRFILRVKGEKIFRIVERSRMDDYIIGRVEWVINEGDEPVEQELENEQEKEAVQGIPEQENAATNGQDSLSSLCDELKRGCPSGIDTTNAPRNPTAFLTWYSSRLVFSASQKQAVRLNPLNLYLPLAATTSLFS